MGTTSPDAVLPRIKTKGITRAIYGRRKKEKKKKQRILEEWAKKGKNELTNWYSMAIKCEKKNPQQRRQKLVDSLASLPIRSK